MFIVTTSLTHKYLKVVKVVKINLLNLTCFLTYKN